MKRESRKKLFETYTVLLYADVRQVNVHVI